MSDTIDPDDEPLPLIPVVDRPRTYICPGEMHAIPRSIHLARLAAFYPNCRNCEHRTDTGQLPRSMVGRLEQSARRVAVTSPFHQDGVRGEYLNQFTQKTAGRIATAVADRLWSDRPLLGRMDSIPSPSPLDPVRSPRGPMVVIGQDSRASSPDICVGVSASLRRMGCDVIDIGCVSRPCLTFAVEHLQAEAGLYVTGGGCSDSWTGLDIVGKEGVPWSMNGTLADIERRSQTEVARPTRLGGTGRFFDASLPYRASLLKHFQELRPLRVVCGCSEPAVLEVLEPLFEGLPCELILHQSERRKRTVGDEREILTSAMEAAMDEASADCGIAIGEDGASLTVFTEGRNPLPHSDVLRKLLTPCGSGQTGGRVVIGPGIDSESRAVLAELQMETIAVEEGAEQMAQTMHQFPVALGVQSGRRFWFRDPFPRCDAAVTLGRLLQILSRDATEFHP